MRKQKSAEVIQLYQDSSKELRSLLLRKLGNSEEAEEIAHDAYLKLCRLSEQGTIREPRKYLFTMALRMALNVLRRRKIEKSYLLARQFEAELPDAMVDAMSVDRILRAEQQLAVVKEALLDLPEKTRYIFLLHRFEGLTYTDIAKKLGMSVKAIEYHMRRALDKVIAAVDGF